MALRSGAAAAVTVPGAAAATVPAAWSDGRGDMDLRSAATWPAAARRRRWQVAGDGRGGAISIGKHFDALKRGNLHGVALENFG